MSSVTQPRSARNLVRQALDSTSRNDLEQSALQLNAGSLSGGDHRTDANALRQVDPLQIGVQHLPLIGSRWESTTITGVFSPPSIARLKMVLCPVVLFRIW
jgi:hypothetical protein